VTYAKLAVFLIAAMLATVMMVNTLTAPVPGDTRTYHAVFTDAQGLDPGSEVRIAGVPVGKVTGVGLDSGQALVTFTVSARQHVPGDATAAIRYADLLGGRYLALSAGDGRGTLAVGATIPAARTQPPVDLTALVNGFEPLFDSISPAQVNQLAAELISIFQGESGTVADLLNQIIAVTGNLADRGAVVTRVLNNLDKVLGTVASDRADLTALISGLTTLTSAAAADRQQIGAALDSGTELTQALTTLLGDVTPAVSGEVGSLQRVSGTLVTNQASLNQVVTGLPDFLVRLNRTLDYGSWVNVYVCNLSLAIAGTTTNLGVGPHSEVCR
jgi:virulence factor Mce-like protein